MLKISGQRIYLEEFTESHLADDRYFQWLRDLRVVRGIHRLEYFLPTDKEQIKSYVRGLLRSGIDCFFAVHDLQSGKFIGTQKIGHIDWRLGVADMGVMIGDAESTGKGYSTEAMYLASKYAFNELSLRKLTGGTSAENVPMRRCFEKLGYVLEGCKRQQLLSSGGYVDHLLYGLLKDELAIPQSER